MVVVCVTKRKFISGLETNEKSGNDHGVIDEKWAGIPA